MATHDLRKPHNTNHHIPRLRHLALMLALWILVPFKGEAQFLRPIEVIIDGQSAVDGMEFASGIVYSPDDKHVYISSMPGIAVFERYGEGNLLKMVQSISEQDSGVYGLGSIAISPDGTQVFATSGDSHLVVLNRNAETGKLTFLEVFRDGQGGVDGLREATQVAVAPDGTSIYVTSQGDDALVHFDRNPGTGKVSFVKAYLDDRDGVDGLNGANALAISVLVTT